MAQRFYSPHSINIIARLLGMSSQKPSPKAAAHAERAERLAAELRENLKRRKAQARARNTAEKPGASDNNNDGDGDKSQ